MNAALPQETAAQLEAWDNPMGLMGFEFVEFASPTPGVLEPLFEKMLGLMTSSYATWPAQWQGRSGAFDAQRVKALCASLHKLRGSASMIGAVDLAAVAEKAEQHFNDRAEHGDVGGGELAERLDINPDAEQDCARLRQAAQGLAFGAHEQGLAGILRRDMGKGFARRAVGEPAAFARCGDEPVAAGVDRAGAQGLHEAVDPGGELLLIARDGRMERAQGQANLLRRVPV